MNLFRLLPVLLLSACATRSVLVESSRHTQLGEHQLAFQVLDQAVRAQQANGSVDAELQAAHRTARIDCLRARAQEHIFQEREDRALADLEELRGIAPEHPDLEPLFVRAKDKKARRIVGIGDDMFVRKDYAGATQRYLDALTVVPELKLAREGLANVKAATEHMSQRAQEEFLEAVRKLPEFRNHEVQWHSANVLYYAPEREEAKDLQQRARRENAQKAVARAKECERSRHFGAALREYMVAEKLVKDLPGLQESIAQMDRELQAAVLIDKAQKSMRAAQFDLAREQLGKAFELSVMARNDIGELVQMTRKFEGEARYKAARDLEVLGKKSEALAAYEALTKDWPTGLSDEKTRGDNLRIDIEGAKKAWAEAEAAEAAGDLPKAIEAYLESERFYAGWKDGKARIARLRAAIAPKPEGAGTTGTTGGSGS